MSHKYNAKKTEVDGIAFDSKREATRYMELKLFEKAGEISDLKLQPKFVLQESFVDNAGHHFRAITYKADFQYKEGSSTVVEEVKGFETETWKLKKKMFLYRYPAMILRVIK